MPLSSREMIRMLEREGWALVRVTGDHHQFKHPSKPGLVTVQHPKKELTKQVISSIRRQAGIK